MVQNAKRDPLIGDPEASWLLTHRLFDAMVDSQTRENHKVLEGGIAPADWPGWKVYAPPLGKGCRCTLIQITATRARKMIESGEGFDLTVEVPDAAGPDPGWSEADRQAEIQNPTITEVSDSVGFDPFRQDAVLLFEKLTPVIRESPGVLQTALYKRFSHVPRHIVSYSLYLADQEGRLVRKKKANSYALFLPGE